MYINLFYIRAGIYASFQYTSEPTLAFAPDQTNNSELLLESLFIFSVLFYFQLFCEFSASEGVSPGDALSVAYQ